MKIYKPTKVLGVTFLIITFILLTAFTIYYYQVFSKQNAQFDKLYEISEIEKQIEPWWVTYILPLYYGCAVLIMVVMVIYINKIYANSLGFEGKILDDKLILQKHGKIETIPLEKVKEFGILGVAGTIWGRVGVGERAVFLTDYDKETIFFTSQYLELYNDLKSYFKKDFNLEEKSSFSQFIFSNRKNVIFLTPKQEEQK